MGSSFQDDSNDRSQPILSTNGKNFVFRWIWQTFARWGCRQAVSYTLELQKLYYCNPQFQTIPKIGHNPYFRPTVKISLFGGFGKRLCVEAAAAVFQTCSWQQPQHTNVWDINRNLQCSPLVKSMGCDLSLELSWNVDRNDIILLLLTLANTLLAASAHKCLPNPPKNKIFTVGWKYGLWPIFGIVLKCG